MTMFFVGFLTMFYTDFHSDYAPVAFPSTYYRAYPGHFAGLQWSPNLSGGQLIELPHKFVEPIPFCFQKCLRPQWGMSTFKAYPEGRRGSPGLPFSFLLLHKRGTLVFDLRGTHYGICSLFLSGMCGTLPDARQIDPPQNWVPLCCKM